MKKEDVEEKQYIVYNFKWKEKLQEPWVTQEVIGHKYFEDSNRMVLYKIDGGILEIPSWNLHYSDLGEDWADKVKQQYEDELANDIQNKDKK